MGKVAFARVDERLVHAQVMMTISPSSNADTIYVVHNESAQDDFMKIIFENAASRTGLGVEVLTLEEAVENWKENKFGDDKVLLITKTIEDMHYLVVNGVEMDFVNVGGNAQKPGTTRIINEVSINKDHIELLKEMSNDFDVEVYIQSTPSTTRVDLNEAIKKVG